MIIFYYNTTPSLPSVSPVHNSHNEATLILPLQEQVRTVKPLGFLNPVKINCNLATWTLVRGLVEMNAGRRDSCYCIPRHNQHGGDSFYNEQELSIIRRVNGRNNDAAETFLSLSPQDPRHIISSSSSACLITTYTDGF